MDGDFGYISSFHTPYYLNNEFSINGFAAAPIMNIEPTDEILSYDGYYKQKLIKASKYKALNGAVSGSLAAGGALAIGATGGLAILAGVFVSTVVTVFEKERYGELTSKWQIYKELPSKYVENIYGYDDRFKENNTTSDLLIYNKLNFFSGTFKKGDFEQFLTDYSEEKSSLLTVNGYSTTQIDQMIHSYEKERYSDYPSCGYFCTYNSISNPKEEYFTLTKPTTTAYAGALNYVTIVVPYIGSYEIKAYDKYEKLLGTKIIYEEDYIQSGSTMSYANIQFAQAENFNFSTQVPETGRCSEDNYIEWGGGVSGAYYENVTPAGRDCAKSHDAYVQDHSAVKIAIRPINQSDYVTVDLVKPMPYANRFMIITLDKTETRKYSCYEESNCTVE